MKRTIQCSTLGQVEPDYCADRVRKAMQAGGWTACSDCADGRREYRRKYSQGEWPPAGEPEEEEKGMGSNYLAGECAACHRPNMKVFKYGAVKGLDGTCAGRLREKRLERDEHGRWVFASFDDAPDGADYNRTLVRFEGGVVSLDAWVEETRKKGRAEEDARAGAAPDSGLLMGKDPAEVLPSEDELDAMDQLHGPEEPAQGERAVRLAMGLHPDPAADLAMLAEVPVDLDAVEEGIAAGGTAFEPGQVEDPFAGLVFEPVGFESSRGMAPALTVSKVREIGLNVAASERISKGGMSRVELSAARRNGSLVLGLTPTAETGTGTYALSMQGAKKRSPVRNVRLACGAALERLGVVPDQKGVPLVWSEAQGRWCAVVDIARGEVNHG